IKDELHRSMVLSLEPALRFFGGLRLRLLRLSRCSRSVLRGLRSLLPVLRLLLLSGLRFLLAASPAAAGATARLFRRRQVLGEPMRHLLQSAELLTGRVDQLVGARRVSLGRREQGRAHLERLLARCIDELGGVLLVPVPTGVGQRAEGPF